MYFEYLQGGRTCYCCNESLANKEVAIKHFPIQFKYGKQKKKAKANTQNSFLVCKTCMEKQI